MSDASAPFLCCSPPVVPRRYAVPLRSGNMRPCLERATQSGPHPRSPFSRRALFGLCFCSAGSVWIKSSRLGSAAPRRGWDVLLPRRRLLRLQNPPGLDWCGLGCVWSVLRESCLKRRPSMSHTSPDGGYWPALVRLLCPGAPEKLGHAAAAYRSDQPDPAPTPSVMDFCSVSLFSPARGLVNV